MCVTTAAAGMDDYAPRFISEPAAGLTINAAGAGTGVQGSGVLLIGGGLDIPPVFGLEVYAGLSGTAASRITDGMTIYSGFSGAAAGFHLLWRSDEAWGILAGPQASWMNLTHTGHAFFYPSFAAGAFVNLPNRKDTSWYLRPVVRYIQHFRKDLAYSATVEIGVSFVQPWSQ